MRKFFPTGPYCLCGQSFGGMVAFEMARQLHEQGQEVGLVGLLDTRVRHAQSMGRIATLVARTRFLFRRLHYHGGNLWRLPLRGKLDYLRGKGRTLKRRIKSRLWQVTYRVHKLARRENHRLPPALLNVKESCWMAAKNYVAQAYPGRVTLFRAKEEGLELSRDPNADWSGLATGGVEIHEIPGNHLTILDKPNIELLARELTLCLRPRAA
jgi:thioesterase domain-containing protein